MNEGTMRHDVVRCGTSGKKKELGGDRPRGEEEWGAERKRETEDRTRRDADSSARTQRTRGEERGAGDMQVQREGARELWEGGHRPAVLSSNLDIEKDWREEALVNTHTHIEWRMKAGLPENKSKRLRGRLEGLLHTQLPSSPPSSKRRTPALEQSREENSTVKGPYGQTGGQSY